MCFQVHQLYANRAREPAINDIFFLLCYMLAVLNPDLITPWILKTIYLKTSIVWSQKLLAGKTASGIAICMLSFVPPDLGFEEETAGDCS